jgi:hypothetical protein
MNCCPVQTKHDSPAGPRRSWRRSWRSASGFLGSGFGSGFLLVLLPKCPLCIAAYLTLFTGASVAVPIAMRLRPLLEIAFAATAAFLLLHLLAVRARPQACTEKMPP